MSHIGAMIGGCSLGVLIAVAVMLDAMRRAARKPRFARKIPCSDCGDLEPLDSLSQCCDCGRLFCCGCFNLGPDDIYHGPWLCEKCQKKRLKKAHAAFPHKFAAAIHDENQSP